MSPWTCASWRARSSRSRTGAAPMTMALAYWVDRLDPFLIHFTGRFGIRYYGLAYAIGLPGRRLAPPPVRPGRQVALCPGPRSATSWWPPCSASSSAAASAPTSSTTAGGPLARDPLAILRVWDGRHVVPRRPRSDVILAVAWYSQGRADPARAPLGPRGLDRARRGSSSAASRTSQRGALGQAITVVPWAVIFPRSMPPGTPLSQSPRAIPPSFTRPPWRAPFSSPTCSAASGGATSSAARPGRPRRANS